MLGRDEFSHFWFRAYESLDSMLLFIDTFFYQLRRIDYFVFTIYALFQLPYRSVLLFIIPLQFFYLLAQDVQDSALLLLIKAVNVGRMVVRW